MREAECSLYFVQMKPKIKFKFNVHFTGTHIFRVLNKIFNSDESCSTRVIVAQSLGRSHAAPQTLAFHVGVLRRYYKHTG